MKKYLLLISLFCVALIAQELDAKVMVNYEQLETKYRDKLIKFGSEIEDYLNNTKFTGTNWEWEKIKCNFNIFFSNASNETQYSAQLVVNSQRILPNKNYTQMLSVLDNAWSFKYEKGKALYFNENMYDALTTLLNYYALIIIGLDSDSYDPFGGNDFYNKALNITILANSANAAGWELKRNTFSKRGLLEDLLGANYRTFREDYLRYHLEGVEILAEQRELAQKNIVLLIENLYKSKDKRDSMSSLLKIFFDAKYKEICEILSDYPDKTIVDKLKIIDPSHISKYNELIK